MTAQRQPDAPLRIAVLSRHFDPSAGGAERYSVTLVQSLAARHDVHVYAQRFGATLPGVTQHAVPAGPRTRWLNQLWFAACTAWQCRRRYDIVHSHEATWYGNVQTVHVRPVKVNLFQDRHGWRRVLRWFQVLTSPRLMAYLLVERARLRPRPDRAIVAVSVPLQREMEQAYPALAQAMVDVVPPGLTRLPVGTAGEREQTRRALDLPPDAFAVLFVANDHRKKGLPALLAALRRLGPAVHLIVVGGAGEVTSSRRQAEAAGVAARVHFVGTVADPGSMYRAADLLVHPALEDTFGMVVPEAMSQGLPVVVSAARWCGVAEDLRHGVDAHVLSDPRDVEAIASAIATLQQDPTLRALYAQAGRAFAQRHDWEHLARRQEVIYRRVAGVSR